MTPCSRIESANSLSASSSKFLRGCCELGRMRSISMSRSGSESKSGVANNAFKPRPKAFLCPMDDLLCQADVTFSALRFDVIEQNRLAVARRFAQPNIAGNDRFKQLWPEESAKVLHHLIGEVRPLIKHGEEYAFNR